VEWWQDDALLGRGRSSGVGLLVGTEYLIAWQSAPSNLTRRALERRSCAAQVAAGSWQRPGCTV